MAVNRSNFSEKSPARTVKIYQFGPFRLDAGQRILTRDGVPVKLKPKTFELLEFLVERNNQVVDKNELMAEVWRDSIVEEANLTVHISNLRKIFAADAGETVTIETFPKIGYRLNAEVREVTNGNIAGSEHPSAEASGMDFQDRPQDSAVPGPNDRVHAHGYTSEKRSSLIATLLVFILGAGIVAAYFFTRSPQNAQTMTRVSGTEQSSSIALSPNGEYIAHAVSKAGKRTLTMTHIGSGSSVQLLPPDEALYLGMTFTRDNSFLYFVKTGDEVSTLYKIPILGGNVVKIVDNIANKISFSPDGTRFCFVRKLPDNITAIVTANSDGTDERVIAQRKAPQFYSGFEISWSPDGKLIANAAGQGGSDPMLRIVGVNAATGEETVLSDTKWSGIDGIEWLSDGSGIVAGMFEKSGSPTHVWFVPFPAGAPRKITNDVENYGSVGVSSDGETIMAGQFKDHSSIWMLPAGRPDLASPVTTGKHHFFRWIRWTDDGGLIFGSSTAGNRDIWRMNIDGTGEQQLTAGPDANVMPVTTPDGKHIVFAAFRDGNGLFELWRMNADATNQVRLTNGGGATQPALTPDGKWAFYTAGKMDGPPPQRRIWKVPIEGGDPVQFVAERAYAPDISPDGRFVACWHKSDANTEWKVAIIPVSGGAPVKLLELPQGSRMQWTPDGKGISYINTVDAVSNVWTQPLDGGPPRQETHFTTEQIFNFDWSKDNRLVCSRFHKTRDVVLIRNFR